MRQFRKYPSNPVTASTETSAELIGYGIDYRNMNTAIHGILWSPDEELINNVLLICQELEATEDEHQYDSYWAELEAYLASNELFIEEEINFRDITKDDRYYFDDNEYIQIVNPVFINLYM